MTDTLKAEAMAEDATNGEAQVNVSNTTDGEVATKNEADDKANVNSDTAKDEKMDDVAAVAEEKTKDVEMHDGNVKEDGKDEVQKCTDKGKTDGAHSPDNKRKDDNDHYRDGNKRSRGGDRSGRGRGGRGRWRLDGPDRGSYKKNANIVRTFEQPESDDPVEIRRQVEFYFSDSNLPIDGYLLGMVEGAENKPVDLRTIHNFKRMRHFQPFTAVVAAVKESELLIVEDRDNTSFVTRKVPLSDKFTLNTMENKQLLTSDTMACSIYAKGFGDETKGTHLEIEEFFAPYGPINSIRLRRTDSGEFKGSVFVEFADVPTMKRFLDLDPKPTWGKDDKELDVMSKEAYVNKKRKDIINGDVRPRSPRRSNHTGHGGGRGHDGRRFEPRRNRDDRRERSGSRDDDWRERRNRFQENGRRDDRKGGRGGRGRGGRQGRDDRSRSPGRKEKEVDEEPLPSRIEAEAKRAQELAESAAEPVADADGGAEKADGESKKRARDEKDDGAAEAGEAKKVKEVEVEA